MKLLGLELVRVHVPFRVDIGTAAGVHRTRDPAVRAGGDPGFGGVGGVRRLG